AAGLVAIGRPSNLGGLHFLAALLKDIPVSRTIIVVGENDRKPSTHPMPDYWPGRHGAYITATELARLIDRPVKWSMVRKAKDARDWLVKKAKGGTHPKTWTAMGVELVKQLASDAIETLPNVPTGIELVDQSGKCIDGFKPFLKGRKGLRHEGKNAAPKFMCRKWRKCPPCRATHHNKYASWFYRCLVQWCDPLRRLEAIPLIDTSEVRRGRESLGWVAPMEYPQDFPTGPWSLYGGVVGVKEKESLTSSIDRKCIKSNRKSEFLTILTDLVKLCQELPSCCQLIMNIREEYLYMTSWQ